MIDSLMNAAAQSGTVLGGAGLGGAGLGGAGLGGAGLGVVTNSAQGVFHPSPIQALAAASMEKIRRVSPRLYIEVEVMTNGYVLAVGDTRLIARDLEELQQHFTAQVAAMLLDKDN